MYVGCSLCISKVVDVKEYVCHISGSGAVSEAGFISTSPAALMDER